MPRITEKNRSRAMTDVEVSGGGTLYRLQPLTERAKEWIEENVSKEGFQPEWPTLYVEHRYIGDLVEAIRAEGMKVL